MPKTNAAGEPSYFGAGPGETATSADGSVHFLDPTLDDATGEDRDDVTVDGKPLAEVRKDEEERRKHEEKSAARRTDAEQAELDAQRSNDETDPARRTAAEKGEGGVAVTDKGGEQSSDGTASKASSSKPAAKQLTKNERTDTLR